MLNKELHDTVRSMMDIVELLLVTASRVLEQCPPGLEEADELQVAVCERLKFRFPSDLLRYHQCSDMIPSSLKGAWWSLHYLFHGAFATYRWL